MSVTVFVTHSSLTDMNAEVKLSSELSVADVKKKRESHVEQGGQNAYGRRPRSPLLARGRNRLRAASGLGEPRPVGKCVFVAGPLASHVEQGPYGRRPQPAPPPPASAQGRLALRSASVSLGQLAGVLCCGPRRPCFLHRLESHCGTAPQHQHLTLLDPAGKVWLGLGLGLGLWLGLGLGSWLGLGLGLGLAPQHQHLTIRPAR